MSEFKELGPEAQVKRNERMQSRLDKLGVTSLVGARIVVDAIALVLDGEEGHSQVVLLDPRKGTDQRIIDQLPQELAPSCTDLVLFNLKRM